MNLAYSHLIPDNFPDNSRVWIYQSNRLFTIGEALELEEMLNGFLARWNAHGTAVRGYGNLLFGQFLVLMADETETQVSGCSTDSSVQLVKAIEQRFQVNMFDRQYLGFVIKGRTEMLPLSQLSYALENGFITGDTLYFNNLVQTKSELLTRWMIPVKDSWLKNKLPRLQERQDAM
ncbi:MAG TPA: hypothetical protein VF145_11570 [Chitinophagaceae bacterium]